MRVVADLGVAEFTLATTASTATMAKPSSNAATEHASALSDLAEMLNEFVGDAESLEGIMGDLAIGSFMS